MPDDGHCWFFTDLNSPLKTQIMTYGGLLLKLLHIQYSTYGHGWLLFLTSVHEDVLGNLERLSSVVGSWTNTRGSQGHLFDMAR